MVEPIGSEKQATKGKPGCKLFQTRHAVALAMLVAVLLVSLVRTSVSVAIVSMTRPQPAQQEGHGPAEDACSSKAATNTSTSDNHQAGGDGEMSWGALEQSYVLGAHSYGSVVFALALSRLAELTGAARVLSGLIAASATLNLLAPTAARAGLPWLVAVRALQGITWSPLYPCAAMLSARWFPPDERLRMSGLVYSAGTVGILVSMGLSGRIATQLGWPAIFYCYGGAMLAWGALCLVAVAEDPATHRWISAEERLYLQERCPPAQKERRAVPWRSIAVSGPVWAYLLQDAGCFWITVVFTSELPTYLSSVLRVDLENAGYLSTLPFVCTWLSNVSSSSLSHWLRNKGLLSHLASYRLFNALASLGPAAVLLGVCWVGCDTVAAVSLVALALFLHGAYFGGSLLNMLDLSVPFAGTLSGLANTLTGLVSIGAPTLVGLLTDGQVTLSAWRTVFYVSAAVTSVPYALYLLLGSVEEQPWSYPEPAEPTKTSRETAVPVSAS